MNIAQKERKLWKKWVKARYKRAADKTAPEKERELFYKWKHVFVRTIVEKN